MRREENKRQHTRRTPALVTPKHTQEKKNKGHRRAPGHQTQAAKKKIFFLWCYDVGLCV